MEAKSEKNELQKKVEAAGPVEMNPRTMRRALAREQPRFLTSFHEKSRIVFL